MTVWLLVAGLRTTVILQTGFRVCLTVSSSVFVVRRRYAEALPAGDVLSRQVDRRNATELFDVLITQALRCIQRPEPLSPDPIQPRDSGTRRLIVLDGLDECYHGDRDVLCQLINKFELSSPDWLYLLVTARDDHDNGQLVSKFDSAQKVLINLYWLIDCSFVCFSDWLICTPFRFQVKSRDGRTDGRTGKTRNASYQDGRIQSCILNSWM